MQKIPSGIDVYVEWTKDGMKHKIKNVQGKRSGGLLKKLSLLVLDEFKSYVTEKTKGEL